MSVVDSEGVSSMSGNVYGLWRVWRDCDFFAFEGKDEAAVWDVRMQCTQGIEGLGRTLRV